jgi:hypothetical protein
MPKWAHPDVLDQGPKFIKDNCTKMLLISGYVAADSYAVVTAAKLAEVVVVTGDFAITNNVNDRRLAGPSAKSANATATSGASPDLHIAFVDPTNSKVLWVTDETSNQVITSGNPVDFPQVTYNSAQPT